MLLTSLLVSMNWQQGPLTKSNFLHATKRRCHPQIRSACGTLNTFSCWNRCSRLAFASRREVCLSSKIGLRLARRFIQGRCIWSSEPISDHTEISTCWPSTYDPTIPFWFKRISLIMDVQFRENGGTPTFSLVVLTAVSLMKRAQPSPPCQAPLAYVRLVCGSLGQCWLLTSRLLDSLLGQRRISWRSLNGEKY